MLNTISPYRSYPFRINNYLNQFSPVCQIKSGISISIKYIGYAPEGFLLPVNVNIFGYFGVGMPQEPADRIHIDSPMIKLVCKIVSATVRVEGGYADNAACFFALPEHPQPVSTADKTKIRVLIDYRAGGLIQGDGAVPAPLADDAQKLVRNIVPVQGNELRNAEPGIAEELKAAQGITIYATANQIIFMSRQDPLIRRQGGDIANELCQIGIPVTPQPAVKRLDHIDMQVDGCRRPCFCFFEEVNLDHFNTDLFRVFRHFADKILQNI